MGRRIIFVFFIIALGSSFISRVVASGSDANATINDSSVIKLNSQDLNKKDFISKDNLPNRTGNKDHQEQKYSFESDKQKDNWSFKDILWSILSGFLGAFIALLVDQYKKPKLDIVASEDANDDILYQLPHPKAGERWKYYRVKVINKPVTKYLAWLINRETAQQISATITVKELDQTLKGRWAGTLELPMANPLDLMRLANFPDPVTLTAGQSAILDVFTKYEHDQEAYVWNNEAYFNDWRTQKYRMVPGKYTIEVRVTSLNGSFKVKTFKSHIHPTINDTNLREE